MALTPVRKWLNIGFGLLLAVFAGFLLWPLVSRPFELRTFCADLPVGTSHMVISDLAGQRGFKVSPQRDGQAEVYDHGSLGKFHCALRMAGDRLVASSFAIGD